MDVSRAEGLDVGTFRDQIRDVLEEGQVNSIRNRRAYLYEEIDECE